jgi:P27 family predicted phage terminase small subunit
MAGRSVHSRSTLVPRLAKTDQQHFLQGTVSQVGRSNTTQSPSKYEGGRPKIPVHLSRVARAEYKRICFTLEQRRTLTEGDRNTIAVLAECVARWVTAKQELGTEYMITTAVKDKEGNLVQSVKANPLLKVVEVCEARILSLQSALGLTPMARDKVRPTQVDAPVEEQLSAGDLYMRNLDNEFQRPRIVPMKSTGAPDDEPEGE